MEDVGISSRLEEIIKSQQQTIDDVTRKMNTLEVNFVQQQTLTDDMTRRMNVMERVFHDLKSIELEQNDTQALLRHECDVDSDRERRRRIDICSFCCGTE